MIQLLTNLLPRVLSRTLVHRPWLSMTIRLLYAILLGCALGFTLRYIFLSEVQMTAEP